MSTQLIISSSRKVFISLSLFLLCSCIFPVYPSFASPEGTQTIRPETTSGMQAFFQTLNYDWMTLDEGVPPLILTNIPADINTSVSTKAKKKAFFMGLLPMILLANQEIEKERRDVLDIIERRQKRTPQANDLERLENISKRYGLRNKPFTDHRARTRLLNRVDTIPPSLVLAQAANESAWGTSRFARQGNNLFGEWTYKPGTGIVPAGRPPGETYEVRKFPSLYESIRSYMNNLNRNGAYRKLRSIRASQRKAGQSYSGMELAKGLINYSQRREEYITEIQAMIRQNKLSHANTALLRQPQKEEVLIISISTSGSGLLSTRNRMIGHTSSEWSDP